MKTEDGCPTTSLHSVPGITQVSSSPSEDSVSQEQEYYLDNTSPADDMDDEFGDLSASV